MKGNETAALDQWRRIFVEWLMTNWTQTDSAHDIQHLHRVWRNSVLINEHEPMSADMLVVLAAAYFHDIITLPKDSKERHLASAMSAKRTEELLIECFTEFPREKVQAVAHAIHAHSFSANVQTQTIEAMIVQDADRLEALGAAGIARLFYTAGKMNSSLYHPDDPLAQHRALDDRLYALDHIELKLLKLPDTMKTTGGKMRAKQAAMFITSFREQILNEISL